MNLRQNNLKFKIFEGLNILCSKDYLPYFEINDKFSKNNSGQFVNSVDKKLHELGDVN